MNLLEKEFELTRKLDNPLLSDKERQKLQFQLAVVARKNGRVGNSSFFIVLVVPLILLVAALFRQ